METKEGRRWIIDAFVFFLPVLFLWVVAALWFGSSLEANVKFLAGIRTSLLADYSPDIFNQSFKSLKLAIFGDVFSDSELPAGAITDLEIALQGLVPTATRLPGMLDWTVTPEIPLTTEPLIDTVPTDTSSPTNTPGSNAEKTQAPIQTSTATPTKALATATQPREKITPLLECVQDNGDGTLTAFFGYQNPNNYKVEIPVGAQNTFAPEPKDRGQPEIFEPGRSAGYPNASFRVVFASEAITWTLDGSSVTASGQSCSCDPIEPEQTTDTDPPQISGGDLNPPPGDLEVCSITVTIDNLRVVDPPISSGIAWVKLKYNVEGYTTDYIFSNPLNLCSGGWTDEGGWDGCYNGAIVIKIDPSWIPPDSSTAFKINLFVKAVDNKGNETCHPLGQYAMPACCGSCQ